MLQANFSGMRWHCHRAFSFAWLAKSVVSTAVAVVLSLVLALFVVVRRKKKTVDRRAVTVRCTRRHKNNRLAPLPFFSSFLFTRIVGKHWLAAVKHKNLPSIPVHRLCFGPAHPAKISCVCQQKCQLCHAFVMVMCCTTFTGISHV